MNQNSLFKTMIGSFISNGKKGKESKIVERQRESVCERGKALRQEEDNIDRKIDC